MYKKQYIKEKFPSKVRGGPVAVGSLVLLISGCAGNLVCSWESDEEHMQRILHEVQHATQTQVEEKQQKTVEPIQQ